ncbi:MAG TPA: DsbE family thiol:disulfide interchange protein, partial [Candidatus Acidoferrum sp.]|nr:DsbE family thiol:disulfide interchange protein [Candidatus Acidoferrum sp.]
KLFIPIVFFLVMAGLLLNGLYQNPNKVPTALLNRPFPAFSKPGLFDETATITADQLKGGIHIVNVWATWCPPCHAEHPYLVEISEREKDITFVGVDYKETDNGDTAREFLKERGNPFKLLLQDKDGSLGLDLGVTGAPETFLVDANGIIRYKHIGAIDNRVWDDVFVPLLKQLR